MDGPARAQMRFLREQVARAHWYQAIPLPGGIVTPGEYDLLGALARIPFPRDLTGRRCLDIGTRDGFWAFEMERRGAAEVVAIDLDDWGDLDWPEPRPRLGPDARAGLDASQTAFGIAHAALGSNVVRRDLSIYAVSAADIGTFDFAFTGTLLHHLRDPVGALMAIRKVLRGPLLCNEVVSVALSLLKPNAPAAELLGAVEPFWWIPNVAGLRRLLTAAGFRIRAWGGPYLMRYGAGRRPKLDLRPAALPRLPGNVILRLGAPHVWVWATPADDR